METLEEVSFRILNVPTLESRGNDSLDFHSLSANQIKKALQEAYLLGVLTVMLNDKNKSNIWSCAKDVCLNNNLLKE